MLLLVAAAPGACVDPVDDDPPRVIDRSGGEFFDVCPKGKTKFLDRKCEPHRIAGVSPLAPDASDCTEPGSVPGFIYTAARLIAVTGGCGHPEGGFYELPDWSRILVCEDDDQCPFQERGQDYECRHGLCQLVGPYQFPQLHAPGTPSERPVLPLHG